jgi:non-ribosomal peptide synthetase component F
VGAAREGARNPIFEVLFVLQDTETQPLRIPGLELEAVALDSGTSLVDLLIHVCQAGNGLTGCFQYDSELFDRPTVEDFRDRFVLLIEDLARDPGRRLGDVPCPWFCASVGPHPLDPTGRLDL